MNGEDKKGESRNIVILYGSDANGNSIGPEEAKSLTEILNRPEVAKCLIDDPEVYEENLHREIHKKLESTKEEKEDED